MRTCTGKSCPTLFLIPRKISTAKRVLFSMLWAPYLSVRLFQKRDKNVWPR